MRFDDDYFEKSYLSLNELDGETGNRYGRKNQELILSMLGPRKGERILDVGCGVGGISYEVEISGATLISMDLSPYALGIGKGKFKLGNQLCADASFIPVPDSVFDKIYAVELLYYLSDQERALGEFRRVLKPGGTLLIATDYITSSFFYPPLNAIRKMRCLFTPTYNPPINHLDPKKVNQQLEKHGFEVCEERYWNAFHMSHLLAKKALHLQRLWGLSTVLDNHFGSKYLCNNMVLLAKAR